MPNRRVVPRYRAFTIAACASALALIISAPASAAPVGSDRIAVGTFSYDVDAAFGPIFTIETFADSPGSFSHASIQLLLAGIDVQDLPIDDPTSDAPDSPLTSPYQTAEFDLTQVVFDTAILSVTFSETGAIAVDPLAGLTFDPETFSGASATTGIFFTPSSSQAVPEPATLLLVAAGVGVISIRRRSHTTAS